jgi:hypothetical protein
MLFAISHLLSLISIIWELSANAAEVTPFSRECSRGGAAGTWEMLLPETHFHC